MSLIRNVRAVQASLSNSGTGAFVRVAAAAFILLGTTAFIPAQQSPADPRPALAEAQRLIGEQQWDQAAPALRQLISVNSISPDARYLLGYVLFRANQPEASLQAYTEAAKLRQPASGDFITVASDYILLKSYTDAERWLLKAIQTPPVDPHAWYLLGRTQYNLDRAADAVESFKHSLALLPEDARSEYNLGLAYERLQRLDLARAAYQTAIQWSETKGTSDAQPYLNLAILNRSEGYPQEALPLLQKAASLSPQNPLIFQELGLTFNAMNRSDDAIAALKIAITLAPSAEPSHFFLGRLYRAAGKTHEADEQFAIAQKLLGTKSGNLTPNTDYPR